MFGTKLGEGWREALYSLRTALLILHTSTISLPITPKLHVLMEHVETWVDRNKQSLGTLREQSGPSCGGGKSRLLGRTGSWAGGGRASLPPARPSTFGPRLPTSPPPPSGWAP